ncbi:MAG: glutathione S-transferase family protein [Deltaproteobacteria bacterium]|nr:glutathione S-transferase family protein [Deltaproteobacteria bacterium]
MTPPALTSPPTGPLTLVTLGPAWGLPFQSSAPFPVKLEAWLRLVGIPYTGRVENDPRKGPKGKSPWIETAEGAVGDSELIIRMLAQRHGVDSEAGLDARARAEGLAWRRLFEEHFHQVWELLTFCTPKGEAAADDFFQQLPKLPRPLIKLMMLRGLKKQLRARGMARHALAEVEQMGIDDIDAAAAHLGEREFWIADRPTLTDCTAFAFLAVTIWTPPVSAVHERARGHANLVAYCRRMGARLFPERMGRLLPPGQPGSARPSGGLAKG